MFSSDLFAYENFCSEEFSGTTQTVPISNLALETLTLTEAANNPVNTYTFQTHTMSTAGLYYSDVSDSGREIYELMLRGGEAVEQRRR